MSKPKIYGTKVLLGIDAVLMLGIENERKRVQGDSKKTPPRTVMIRTLVLEGIQARCAARGEPMPTMVPVDEVSAEASSPPT